ncbi:MAG: hypothetical protein EOP83_28720, partial [Verrucomicrobiaceae bacterium]
VFMILSQSAAIAADLALDGNLSVQQVPYTQLRPALLAASQALGEPAVASPTSVVDNTDTALVALTGAWISGTSSAGFIGADYVHDNNAGQGTKQVAYSIPAGTTGMQRIFLRWTSHTNRASNVPVEILHAGGITTITVDQKINGSKWNLLGHFNGVQKVTVKTTGANGYVVADAVGFSAVGENDDSDFDGMSDMRELELGLDPFSSDTAFIDAVKQHPEYFDLHSTGEIHDLRIARAGYTPGFFGFRIEGGATWEVFEDFQLAVPHDGARRFYRVALQAEPAKLVAALAASQPRKVVVYGTSLTASGAWVSQMSQWLSAKYPSLLTVINSGLSGKNSAEGLAQLQAKVLNHHPDTVFIEFAMNDAFLYSDGTPQLSVEQARANLNAMIDAILTQNPQAEIILQTMNTVWDSPSGSNQSASLRPNLAAYYEMYRSVAAARGLMLIDHQPAWSALQQGDLATFQSWVPDGVHPVANGLSKVVLPLLKWKLTGGKM